MTTTLFKEEIGWLQTNWKEGEDLGKEEGGRRKSLQSQLGISNNEDVGPVKEEQEEGTESMMNGEGKGGSSNEKKKKKKKKVKVNKQPPEHFLKFMEFHEAFSRIANQSFLAFERELAVMEEGGEVVEVENKPIIQLKEEESNKKEIDLASLCKIYEDTSLSRFQEDDIPYVDLRNSSEIRKFSQLFGRLVSSDNQVLLQVEDDLSKENLLENEAILDKDRAMQKKGKMTKIQIPPKSKFLITDFSRLPTFLDDDTQQYDVVIMDPPWENASVNRAKSAKYDTTLDPYELFKLPIKSCLKCNGLVCVWVTNKPKIHKFVVERLFPSFNISLFAIVLWIKIDRSGNLIFPIENNILRKPYEVLYIASKSKDFPPTPIRPLVYISRTTRHSRKPNIDKVLAYIYNLGGPASVDNFSDLEKLELFARQARTGWLTWGNEALKFNISELS